MSYDRTSAAVSSTSEERMKRFLASASHDLQSPLRHIAMYAEILLDDLGEKLDGEQRESLTAILQKAQTAQRLTKALMSFAAGTPQLSPAPLELGGLIDSIWAELINEMAAREATISCAPASNASQRCNCSLDRAEAHPCQCARFIGAPQHRMSR